MWTTNSFWGLPGTGLDAGDIASNKTDWEPTMAALWLSWAPSSIKIYKIIFYDCLKRNLIQSGVHILYSLLLLSYPFFLLISKEIKHFHGPLKVPWAMALCPPCPVDKLASPGLCYHGTYILVGVTKTKKVTIKSRGISQKSAMQTIEQDTLESHQGTTAA